MAYFVQRNLDFRPLFCVLNLWTGKASLPLYHILQTSSGLHLDCVNCKGAECLLLSRRAKFVTLLITQQWVSDWLWISEHLQSSADLSHICIPFVLTNDRKDEDTKTKTRKITLGVIYWFSDLSWHWGLVTERVTIEVDSVINFCRKGRELAASLFIPPLILFVTVITWTIVVTTGIKPSSNIGSALVSAM